MITPRIFTGGDLATNGYLLEGRSGWLCFDAPEGQARELERLGIKPVALILTHGHFDHMWDAAQIQAEAQCPVYVHDADAQLVRDPSYVTLFGLPTPPRPVHDLTPIPVSDRGETIFSCGGEEWKIAHVPGHSPGSVVFYHGGWNLLIGGDVLFCGGVGRWDLPGGSRHTLLTGIQKHLVPLPPETRVYAGHGPMTTIGYEKETNPYLEMI